MSKAPKLGLEKMLQELEREYHVDLSHAKGSTHWQCTVWTGTIMRNGRAASGFRQIYTGYTHSPLDPVREAYREMQERLEGGDE